MEDSCTRFRGGCCNKDRFPARMDLTSLGDDIADIALAALAPDSLLVPEEAS